MDSKLGARDSDPHHDDTIALAPDHFARAGDALAILVHEAARAAADRRPDFSAPPRSDFSAEPRIATPVIDVAPRVDGDGQGAGESRPGGRRPGRALLRFVAAVGIGVAATLAWQSHGEEARAMIATYVPALGWSSSTDMTQPGSATANEAPERAPGQANAAAPAQDAAPAPTASPSAVSAAPELAQEIRAMARELAALRQSVQQLTAGQDQMARTIAKLQTAEDDLRTKLASPPPARKPATKPPQPAPQALAPGPRPLSQSFVPSPGPPPPQPRPAAGMP